MHSISGKIRDARITSKLLALYVVMILLFIGSAVLYYFGSYRALVREGQELSDILVRQTKTAFTTSINNTTRAIFDNYKVQLLSNCLTGQDDGENYYAYAYSIQNALIEFLSLADGVNWIVAVDVNDEPFYSSRSASVPIAYDYLGNLEQDKRDCREGRGRLLWRAQEDGTVNISRMLFALPSMQYTGYVIINMDASVFYQDAHRLSNAGSIVFDSYGAPMLHNLDASMEPFLALDPDSREDIPAGCAGVFGELGNDHKQQSVALPDRQPRICAARIAAADRDLHRRMLVHRALCIPGDARHLPADQPQHRHRAGGNLRNSARRPASPDCARGHG